MRNAVQRSISQAILPKGIERPVPKRSTTVSESYRQPEAQYEKAPGRVDPAALSKKRAEKERSFWKPFLATKRGRPLWAHRLSSGVFRSSYIFHSSATREASTVISPRPASTSSTQAASNTDACIFPHEMDLIPRLPAALMKYSVSPDTHKKINLSDLCPRSLCASSSSSTTVVSWKSSLKKTQGERAPETECRARLALLYRTQPHMLEARLHNHSPRPQALESSSSWPASTRLWAC